jgi:two-component system sensor histidine kinase RegB
VRTTIRSFMDKLAEEWQDSRPVRDFSYVNRIRHDLPVAFDSALKQMIDNVLDNALEASPDWVGLEASVEDGTLQLSVLDRGPGFAPAMLAQFGKPYQSSKGRPGGGLGLFLVVNVARTLGGTVAASNRPEGGAVVRLTLPLKAIALDKD